MNELEKLGLKYKTDKGTKHNYLKVYYDLFNYKKDEIRKILEIGVAEGAGLRMFRDFFKNALIYGIDNLDERVFEEAPIFVYKADQGNVTELLDIWDSLVPGVNDIDLIIDDGSHIPEHQILTCLTLAPLQLERRPSAIYIIEDVANTLVPEIISRALVNFDIEVKKVGDRYDDRLVIVRHKP